MNRVPSANDPSADEPGAVEEPVVVEITDVLDLHPFQPQEISAVVENYLEEARAKGFTTVRIIHGKGTGAQRAQVRSILQRTPFVASFGDAPLEAGSWGATIVWLTSEPPSCGEGM